MNIHAVVAQLDEYTPKDFLEYWTSFEGAEVAKQRILDKGFYSESELSIELIEVNS